jgi:hypothetical protein
MNRKEKLNYLKSIISGTDRKTLAPGESYWPPLCINPDRTITEMHTGEAPRQAQIDKADQMPGFAGYIRFTN